nr:ROK family transcriptional regulator [Halanaerobacter jeridensis]
MANIYKLIHKLGPISRKDLADKTDYSSATISNHVKTLIKQDFVLETKKGTSTGGRRPVYLKTNPEKGYMFSIDIEVNQVKIVLFNLDLKIVMKNIIPITNKSNSEEVIDNIFKEIDSIIAERDLNVQEILGIGIAVPGLIDKEEGVLKFAPNLTWSDLKICELFKNKYNLPIILENEANAAAIGEKDFVYPDSNNLVYVSINEGIGCGVIFNNELYKGASGNAGEFGHIIIDRSGPKCHCGNNGCWESLASENYIVEQVSENNNLTKKEIYHQAQAGNEEVINVLNRTGQNIGVGISNIINSLSPELVIIGGGITAIKDYIFSDIMMMVEEEALEVSYDKSEIKFSELENLATVYGLASLIFNEKLVFSK